MALPACEAGAVSHASDVSHTTLLEIRVRYFLKRWSGDGDRRRLCIALAQTHLNGPTGLSDSLPGMSDLLVYGWSASRLVPFAN